MGTIFDSVKDADFDFDELVKQVGAGSGLNNTIKHVDESAARLNKRESNNSMFF